jgi:8-oxo-dGTP diphosphatase
MDVQRYRTTNSLLATIAMRKIQQALRDRGDERSMTDWYETSRWTDAPRHIVSAAVVATDAAGRVLLVRSPRRGWEMPGGQVELGESLEAAAIREVREESGIDVDDLRFCGIFQTLDRSVVNVLFRARCIGGAPCTSEESVEVGFFEPETALDLVQHADFRQRIAYCLDRSLQPFLVAATID